MRHMPLTGETYEHAVTQIPRDGTSIFKFWLLVSRDPIDETLPRRRLSGCALRPFCRRCITKVPERFEDLFCKECIEHLAVEANVSDGSTGLGLMNGRWTRGTRQRLSSSEAGRLYIIVISPV